MRRKVRAHLLRSGHRVGLGADAARDSRLARGTGVMTNKKPHEEILQTPLMYANEQIPLRVTVMILRQKMALDDSFERKRDNSLRDQNYEADIRTTVSHAIRR